MTDQNDPRTEAADPATPGARLAELAYAHENLRAVIAANPSAYPGLLDWLDQVGDDHTKATVAWVRAGGHEAAAAHAAAQAAEAQAAAQAAQVQPTAAYPTTPFPNAPAQPFQNTPAQPFQNGPAQPFQNAPAQPFQNAAAPAAYPGYPGGPGYPAAQSAPRRPKKWLFIGIAAGLVVLLAGGGAFAYFAFFSKLGGASSPEASAEKLFDSVSSFDAVSLYGAISPSEIGTLTDSFDRLKDLKTTTDDGDTVDYSALVQKALDSSSITFDDMEYDVEEIAEDISKVTVVSGSVHIETDAAAVADAYGEIMRAQYESQGDAYGYSESDIDDLIADSRTQIEDQLDEYFPYDVDADEIEESIGQPVSLVSVKEGGNWYVSPLLTAGEYVLGSVDGDRGELVDAAEFRTPEDALEGFLEGTSDLVENGDLESFASSLPLAERRFVSLYGPVYMDRTGLSGAGTGLSIDTFEVSPDVSGDIARIAIDRLVLSMNGSSEGSLEIEGTCATIVTEYSDESGCLDDIPQASKLGLDEARIVAVKEGGSWFVSPISTISDISAIVTEHAVELSNDGELEDLFK